jgi:multiple sugar transport system ATP-binding protein
VASVSLKEVSKVFPAGTEAVKDLTLEIQDGEFVVLVGPSGCGKTTVLRMIAGLEDITAGTVAIGDTVVNGLSPSERDVAMVFQNYALYPHMSVRQNIGFALRYRKVPKGDAKRRVEEAGGILGLLKELDRKPGELSGGQRQRVAMGRAIVREPAAFLMDEPLSNLDAKLRVHMRGEILNLQRRLGVATLYVTHDQIEAMTMGDKVAVMRDGVLQQCAPPREIYDHPVNLFVAGFIGSPAMNLYEGEIVDSADGAAVIIGDQQLDLSRDWPRLSQKLAPYKGRRVVVGIRPESLSPDHPDSESRPALRVKVELVEILGPELLVHFRINAKHVFADEESLRELSPDTGLPALTAAQGFATAGARTPIEAGEELSLGVALDEVRFFDPANGQAID